jgi:hypothetical protein
MAMLVLSLGLYFRLWIFWVGIIGFLERDWTLRGSGVYDGYSALGQWRIYIVFISSTHNTPGTHYLI